MAFCFSGSDTNDAAQFSIVESHAGLSALRSLRRGSSFLAGQVVTAAQVPHTQENPIVDADDAVTFLFGSGARQGRSLVTSFGDYHGQFHRFKWRSAAQRRNLQKLLHGEPHHESHRRGRSPQHHARVRVDPVSRQRHSLSVQAKVGPHSKASGSPVELQGTFHGAAPRLAPKQPEPWSAQPVESGQVPPKKESSSRWMSLEPIIFQDVDGVLNRYVDDSPMLEKGLLKNLKTVIDRTGANLVITSQWRKYPDDHMLRLKQALHEVGVGPHKVIGVTPQLCSAWQCRSREIFEFLRDHPNLGHAGWVAVDDQDLEEQEKFMHGHFVKTHPLEGLSVQKAQELVNILRNPASGFWRKPKYLS